MNDYKYDPDELDVEDHNTCECCFSQIRVMLNGSEFLDLLESLGASSYMMDKTKERFNAVENENYARIARIQIRNIGTK